MRRLGIVAVGLALVVGIVVGGMVGNPFDTKASASTAAAGQQREDQILLTADGHGIQYAYESWQWLGRYDIGDHGPGPFLVALDSADYPANSTFRLEAVFQTLSGSYTEGATTCVRLSDQGGGGVSGTEACHTGPPNPETSAIPEAAVRVRSGPVALASGEHEYSLQGEMNHPGYTRLNAARIIVEWTQPYAVGGFAELPAVAGTGTSGMGSATYAVLAGAAAGVLAFAVLATLSVRRWQVR